MHSGGRLAQTTVTIVPPGYVGGKVCGAGRVCFFFFFSFSGRGRWRGSVGGGVALWARARRAAVALHRRAGMKSMTEARSRNNSRGGRGAIARRVALQSEPHASQLMQKTRSGICLK